MISVQNGAGVALAGLTILDRGYTGHEHLQSVGLINMNGRIYDPKLHRFLQPDNYVQDPTNTQSYNRYGYCWNNPLKYADYNGEIFGYDTLVLAVIGGVINWGIHGFQLNSQGALAFGIGAVGGAMLSYGNVAGLTFFQAGSLVAATAVTSSLFTSTANHIAFGDPLMTGKELLITAGVSFLGGGFFRAPRVPVSTVSELTPTGIVGVQAESTIAATAGPTTIANVASKAVNETSKELAKSGIKFTVTTNLEGLKSVAVSGITPIVDESVTPLGEVLVTTGKTGGRLGNIFTRMQMSEITKELESRGYDLFRGGGRPGLKEEYLKPLNGGRSGGSYLDGTYTHPEYPTLRINTVDMLKNGSPTPRELINAARIRTQIPPGEHLMLIPKR